MTLLLVMAGAFVGAPARYLTDRWVQSRHETAMPWGTFTVNVAGSALLGALGGALSQTSGGQWAAALVGTGFCGALTTFSTFGFETVRLLEQRRAGAALANVGLSVLAGAAVCAAAWWAAASVA